MSNKLAADNAQGQPATVYTYSEWLEQNSRSDNPDARSQYDQYLSAALGGGGKVLVAGKMFDAGTDTGRFAAQKLAHSSTALPSKAKPLPGAAGAPSNIPTGANNQFGAKSLAESHTAAAPSGPAAPANANVTVTLPNGQQASVPQSAITQQSSLDLSTFDPTDSITTQFAEPGSTVKTDPGLKNTTNNDSSNTIQSAQSLEDQLPKWDSDQLTAFQQKLSDAGYKVSVTGVADLQTISAYQQLLNDTWVAQSAGQKITPDDVLAQKTQAITSGSGSRVKSTTVDLTDPLTAQGILNTALENRLGRKATPAEVSQFTAALQAAENANPTVETQAGSTTSQSDVKAGGIDPTQVADDFVTQQHGAEANADQVGGLFSLAMNAINSPTAG